MPPQIAATRPYRTRRTDLGHYVPRRFSVRSRHRFEVTRRRAYLARIVAPPSPWQTTTISTLVALEWSALEAESHIGDMYAAREAREHRRLFQRLLADFERSLTPPTAPVPDPMQALHDHLARRQRVPA